MAKIVVLTGAGVSAESGLRTFRDHDGLWEGHAVEEVATPEAFMRQPEIVHRFYNQRRQDVKAACPNEAHLALARLENALGEDLLLVTQNVDDLHERAGGRRVWHMHGQLGRLRCVFCDYMGPCPGELTSRSSCCQCGEAGGLRPDIVWFGEVPYYLDEIAHHLAQCELFVAIGTSGAVYPAGNFVNLASYEGARTLELNLARSENSARFSEVRLGPATQVVSAWVAELLG
ncbi:NAD-dependent deacylase [Roseibacillus ishigakijimensis]|uniref:NAD-dependent protein deacylase n=1 Tax=Roseibacillus ishigakijimensis TaxID=454146 RepID=A0A934RRW2_9BACT|nr:NAD-dependent deacylase [Roseibacillus ishigakijimensis]MBK1834792.1 NAD-dependent deacylase [Roseibacillus ishigakijimensis]